MNTIRQPAVAGYFYPKNKSALLEQLNHLFESKYNLVQFNSNGFIAPHAGYVYSGDTAAASFSSIKDKSFKRAVILSPSHREYFPGISIYNGNAFATPLGINKLDEKFCDQLCEGSKNIFRSSLGHNLEHGIEVLIPFIQVKYGDIPIVPIVFGDQGDEYVAEISNRLKNLVDEDTLLIASSDLSHFYPAEIADKKDQLLADDVSSMDIQKLENDLRKRNCEACGYGPILTLMNVFEKDKSSVIQRTHSGYVSGDFSEVVGYLSAVFYN